MKDPVQATATSTFDELKKRVVTRFQGRSTDQVPLILVGTATCGRAAGALDVVQAIKDTVKKKNLNCLLYEVGCLGH